MGHIDTQFISFVVGNSPYCFWDDDISNEALKYLDTLDAGFFESMANVLIAYIDEGSTGEEQKKRERLVNWLSKLLHIQTNLPDCDPQHAAIALRLIYSQALETFFALLCAFVQAPNCPQIWMLKYRPSELRNLLRNITANKPILWRLRAERPSWNEISKAVHMSLVLDDKDKENKIKRGFAQFWSRLARDFVTESFTEEYNSIKHGLRIQIGGFSFAMGRQDTPGVPAPKERMRLLGRSEFGSSFLGIQQIGEHKRHFQILRSSRNWSPTDMAWALHLLSMSMQNLIGGMRILNGIPAETVTFEWPDDFEVMNQPWKRGAELGINSMTGWGNVIHPGLIKPFTKDELLELYSSVQAGGIIRRIYENGELENLNAFGT